MRIRFSLPHLLVAAAIFCACFAALPAPARAQDFIGGLLFAYSPVMKLPYQGKDYYSQVSTAADAGAQQFITSMGDRAIGFLSNESLDASQKREEFRKLLRSSFDMGTIGRFALGRYWKTSTPEQQQEYLKLFEAMVVEVYAARFDEYKGQRFETVGHRPDGEKDVLVTSYIVPDAGEKIQVDWRVRNKDGQYRIVDVIIEGVSMALTQRSDFASVIQRGGGDIQVLLAHLRQK